MIRILCFFFGVFAVFALFTQPVAVATGIYEGGQLCLQVLLPSLFPFMIITAFLSLCGALALPAKLLSPLFKLMRLPVQLGEIWLASFIGGYPTGAHTLSVLVEQGYISRQTAPKMLRCCVNPGPAFLVLAVGQGMFGSRHIGVILLLSQLISSLMLCALTCRNKKQGETSRLPKGSTLSCSNAFVTAVSGSASSMINIFAFVLTFSVLLTILNTYDSRLSMIASSLEVTLGCATAARLGDIYGLLLTAFFLGFGGFSVGFQVLSLARQAQIDAENFWRTRLLAGMLNAGILRIMLFFDKSAIATMVVNSRPVAIWSVDRLLGAACLAAMLLISMQKLEPADRKLGG